MTIEPTPAEVLAAMAVLEPVLQLVPPMHRPPLGALAREVARQVGAARQADTP